EDQATQVLGCQRSGNLVKVRTVACGSCRPMPITYVSTWIGCTSPGGTQWAIGSAADGSGGVWQTCAHPDQPELGRAQACEQYCNWMHNHTSSPSPCGACTGATGRGPHCAGAQCPG